MEEESTKPNEEREDYKKEYQLPEDEHNRISKDIINSAIRGKTPVEHPTMIINMGPPGSGKTILNILAKSYFENENVIVINGDEYRAFHPNNLKIRKEHSDDYASIVSVDSGEWTRELLEYAIEHNYNIIFEGTGRNARILETIRRLMPNYNVIVRGMAVDDITCMSSIIERYQKQIECEGSRKVCKGGSI